MELENERSDDLLVGIPMETPRWRVIDEARRFTATEKWRERDRIEVRRGQGEMRAGLVLGIGE